MQSDAIIFLLIIVIFAMYCQLQMVQSVHESYHEPLIDKLKNDMVKVDSRIANIQFFASNESYTLDKSKVYLCLRDKTGTQYDYNFLVYVALHECSHVLSNKFDERHVTPEFINTFSILRDKAKTLGIWDDTKPLISDYCNYNLKTSTKSID